MKSVLLLILSLTAGCEASSEVKGCEGGWVEFTCKYPRADQEYQKIEVIKPSEKIYIQITKKDVWEEKGRFSLYHDTRNKNLRMAIKLLKSDDSGEYQCKFYPRPHSSPETQKLELEVVKGGCTQFTPFNQTAYRTAKTTITCDYPNEYNSSVKFICKDNNEICEEILSTQSSVKSNGTFTLTDTNSGFNMSISNVNSQHAGVYWCEVKSNEGSYRASLRKIQLQVKSITIFKRSPTIGQDFKYWCNYTQGAPIKKFICKGEDPSICQPLWSTSKPKMNTGKFSMEDDTKRRNITITVRNVTTDDTGTYWCGAVNNDNKRSKTFFNKLEMTVGCEASSEVKGCERGWVELTCKYPREDQEYQKIEVINSRGSSIQTTKKDVWDGDDRFPLYHDTRNKNLRMAIKQLEHDDSGEYQCKFYPRPHSSPETQKLELKVVKDGCQTPFTQTAYETAKTTITCDYPNEYSYVKFICKDNNEICEEILSTQSSVKSNRTFTLTDTNSFNVSISNVSSQHAGVYWCGVKSNEGSYRVSLRKIQLQVKSE
ncbi:polymeric immunoglobulin receptor-like [Thunnus maccoyii]|uniref:polymeric immunoglobulin receptor-like n=1 Tax=Thunnus maccoyii TaxID=8240 RepID=UPI001C4AFB12|nr:polymeric immunoglobulin receptor-like [Thunnus maccoyii]